LKFKGNLITYRNWLQYNKYTSIKALKAIVMS